MPTVIPKHFLLLSLFVPISFGSLCQGSYLGLKGGYNLSRLNSDGDSRIELNDRHAYNAALVYDYQPGNLPIGFSLEPGYTLKGTRVEHDTLDYRFHYLSTPILLNYYPIKKIKVSFGPEISYLVAAKNRSSDSTTVSIRNTYDKRWEVSGTVGVSYSLDFFVDLGVRYNTAFSRVSDLDAVLERRKLFNQYLQVFLLFKIAN